MQLLFARPPRKNVCRVFVERAQVAVVESTAGGLIASSIMRVDGASSVFYGGTVAYNTKRSKPLLLNDEALHASLSGASAATADAYKASKTDWTAKTALAYCEARRRA